MLFSCFSVGDSLTQGSGLSYLYAFGCIWCWHFLPSTASPRGVASVLFFTACASGVSGAMVLTVLLLWLTSWPGYYDIRYPWCVWGDLSGSLCDCGGAQGSVGGPGHLCLLGCQVCSRYCHCGWWRGQNHGRPHGSEVMGPTHIAALLPVAIGSSVTGARATGATSSAAAGFSGAVGSKHHCGRPGTVGAISVLLVPLLYVLIQALSHFSHREMYGSLG